MINMEIKVIDKEFALCKLNDLSQVDYSDEFCFIGKTDEEISLVCATDRIPDNALECDRGWRAFRFEGVLAFSLIGVLSKMTTLLAENDIGIFAVSTYNTDYILTKAEDSSRAIELLGRSGYAVRN